MHYFHLGAANEERVTRFTGHGFVLADLGLVENEVRHRS